MLIAIIVVIFSVVTYMGQRQANPVTGEVQHVALDTREEVVLGLQAAPEMAAQHGGFEEGTREAALVARVGNRLVQSTEAKNSPYQFEFHLLRDPQTINAFALPGGQIFITRALLNQLETEGQLAGVLGHEIGHVVNRHGAEQMARQGLTQGLAGAAVIATSDDQGQGGQMAIIIANLVSMKYGRNDELESDKYGLKYMAEAGYDPRALMGVMRILERAGGSGGQPEFLSTHPKPANRVGHIEELIRQQFPQGLPPGLIP
ncbi:MAG: M48 family metallopeptidase [Fimbriimonadaceae bacterium]|nr:M48 family metallopeptidase [Fimbriimonadaceae bacterium]